MKLKLQGGSTCYRRLSVLSSFCEPTLVNHIRVSLALHSTRQHTNFHVGRQREVPREAELLASRRAFLNIPAEENPLQD